MALTRILFVCLGNICRSPLAEGILRRMAEDHGASVHVDSAGTADYHVGELPDDRARNTGVRRGCEMNMRARQFRTADFDEFDLILTMDHANLREVQGWSGAKPEKVHLAMSFAQAGSSDTVPDPYYGRLSDFEAVADMLELACEGILQHVAKPQSHD